MYDYQGRAENIELMTSMPERGTRRVSRCWLMPRSYDETAGALAAVFAIRVVPSANAADQTVAGTGRRWRVVRPW